MGEISLWSLAQNMAKGIWKEILLNQGSKIDL